MGDVEEGKVCAILAYLLVGIIWYFADEKMRKNEFAKFHAKQGLVLIIASVLVNVALQILPYLGWAVIPAFQIVILVLVVLGIINAANGATKELPVIGQLANKLKF